MKIVRHAGRVRRRYERLNFKGDGIPSLFWNDVVEKRIADRLSGWRQSGRRGVIDRTLDDRPAERIGAQYPAGNCLAEITVSIRCGRNRKCLAVDRQFFAILLEIKKEECLIPTVVLAEKHRTTCGKAIVVPSGNLARIGDRVTREWLTRVQGFIGAVVVHVAMKLIRA